MNNIIYLLFIKYINYNYVVISLKSKYVYLFSKYTIIIHYYEVFNTIYILLLLLGTCYTK